MLQTVLWDTVPLGPVQRLFCPVLTLQRFEAEGACMAAGVSLFTIRRMGRGTETLPKYCYLSLMMPATHCY